MWESVGLRRTAAGLREALDTLRGWRTPEITDAKATEDANLLARRPGRDRERAAAYGVARGPLPRRLPRHRPDPGRPLRSGPRPMTDPSSLGFVGSRSSCRSSRTDEPERLQDRSPMSLQRHQIERVVSHGARGGRTVRRRDQPDLRAGHDHRHRRARRSGAGDLRRRRGVRGRHDRAGRHREGHAADRRRRPLRHRSGAGPGRGVGAGDPAGGAGRAQPRAADVRRRHPDRSLRRGRRRYARAGGRHPQDHTGTPGPGTPCGAVRRRPQPPLLAVGRRDGQGQPPGRGRRHRGGHPPGARGAPAHDAPRGGDRPTRASWTRCWPPVRTRSCSTTSPSTTWSRASAGSTVEPSWRPPAASPWRPSPPSPRPGST